MKKVNLKKWLFVIGALLLAGLILILVESGVFTSSTRHQAADSVRLEKNN